MFLAKLKKLKNVHELRLTIKYFLFSLLPLLLILILSEGVLFFLDAGRPFDVAHKLWEENGRWGAPLEMFEEDSDVIFRPRPNFHNGSIALNSLGCRDEEFNKKADIKILTLGDSVDFGWGVPDYLDTYSEQLEKMLAMPAAKKNLTVDVLDGGVPSYKLFQGFQIYLSSLAQVADWDFVVVSFGWNEPLEDDEALEFIRRHPPGELKVFRLLRMQAHHLRTFNVLESAYLRYTAKPGGGREDVIFEEYRRVTRNIVKAVRSRGSRVVFLSVQPRQEDKLNAAEQTMGRFNEIMKEQVDNENVFYVDTDPFFAKYRPGFYDNVHFNEQGHRLTAEALYNTIVKELNL